MSREIHYDKPFYWWGPGWGARPELRLADLLRDGTLDSWQGAWLWAALARRTSLVVISEASGAGKTTLLTALLELLPPAIHRIYPRGSFESFAFLADPAVPPNETVLLVNELSPHLPVYLWGAAVARLLDAVDCGFQVLATAHAATAPQFIGMLTGSPLHLPAPRVAAFELVVVLEASAKNESERRVGEIWWLQPARDGVVLTPFAPQLRNDISPENHVRPDDLNAVPIKTEEIQWRASIFDDLRDGRIERIPAADRLPNSDDPHEEGSAP
ncbi:MAG: hypothetical protein M3Q50_07205 [Chloroflexota bacterium]|nr:hypothetical protein [Chloroflexota bacterium]